uniref:Ig-like domain-containing protein n=1 Tax=Hucho hucho TaxID=62062 RepID=A0A4W5PF22_9TELE
MSSFLKGSHILKTFIVGDSGFGIVGQAPLLRQPFYSHLNTPTFYGEFINPEFAAEKSGTSFVLTIADARPTDVGMYYCAACDYDTIIFGNCVYLMHEGKSQHVVQQAVSESVQPRDSVTLNCTKHTETCTREHSVYWFRNGSGESHPGIIYTNGDRSDQYVESPEAGSRTQSFVYNLPKRNLRDTVWKRDQARWHDSPFDLSPTVLMSVVSNIVLGIGTTLLVWVLCTTRNRETKYGATSQENQNQDSDVLNYAAVSFTPKENSSSRRAREKTNRDDAVYSEVRHLQQQ